MKKMILVLALTLGACASKKMAEPAPVVKPLPQTLQAAVNSDRRTESNKARDVYRHPQETLEFFDIRPEHTVVEIVPGGGWYTEIIAPYVATNGRYIGTIFQGDMNHERNANLLKWTQANPDVAAKMSFVELSSPNHLKLGDDNSADRVVTFRNVHNWMKNKDEKKFFKAFFEVLKPGGILGVVEHRATAGKKNDASKTGYVTEKEVIAMAKSAGFKLLEKSEINANPKDTKNHPAGVWTLPPTLKLGDKDREKYLAIGESDRMTLKFIKPAQ